MKGRAISYSPAELEFLERHSKKPRRELTEIFNKRFGRSISVQNIHALCKRNGWMAGSNGQFKPGNVPHPDARPKGPNSASFQKGHQPWGTLKLGAERLAKDGYIEVKMKKGWIPKQRLIWSVKNGDVPKGYVVAFLDGDYRNFDLDNLICVHRGVLAIRNHTANKHKRPALAMAMLIYETNDPSRIGTSSHTGRK